MKKKALVLFSGGQDSTICLHWAKENFEDILALNIDYGQRHRLEIQSARIISQRMEIELIEMHDILMKGIADSALFFTNREMIINGKHRSAQDLPASFVPGRNIYMLTIAAMKAFPLGISDIVCGVCQMDYSGYPDCRDNTIKSFQVSLSLAMNYEFTIHTPLMWKTKAESILMARTLKGCMESLAYSHTCYEGVYPPCGKCPSCILRSKGFEEAGIEDPIFLSQRKEYNKIMNERI